MKRMASNTAFISKMQYEPHQPGDVILVTGVGAAFPFPDFRVFRQILVRTFKITKEFAIVIHF